MSHLGIREGRGHFPQLSGSEACGVTAAVGHRECVHGCGQGHDTGSSSARVYTDPCPFKLELREHGFPLASASLAVSMKKLGVFRVKAPTIMDMSFDSIRFGPVKGEPKQNNSVFEHRRSLFRTTVAHAAFSFWRFWLHVRTC